MTAAAGVRSARRVWSRAAFGVLLAVHLLALYWPRIDIEGAPQDADKWSHLVLFGAPVAVACLAIGRARWLVVVVVLFAVHAPLSEVVQAQFLPGRSGDVRDAIADVVGVALGAVVGLLLRRRVAAAHAGRIG